MTTRSGQAVSLARLGRAEKLDALRRLDAQARRLESNTRVPAFEAHLESERSPLPWAAAPSAITGRARGTLSPDSRSLRGNVI